TAWCWGLSPVDSKALRLRSLTVMPSRFSRNGVLSMSSRDGPTRELSGASAGTSAISMLSVLRQALADDIVVLFHDSEGRRYNAASSFDDDRKPEALERPRPDRRRAVHGHPRRCDRECRAAFDQVRPGLLAGESSVGDLRLRDHLRRHASARRAARRSAWSQAAVHGRAGGLLAEL